MSLVPEAFEMQQRLEDREGVQEGSSVISGTKWQRSLARTTVQLLVQHQASMHLFNRVRELLSMPELDFDNAEYFVCESRTFVFVGNPRRSTAGNDFSHPPQALW